MNATLSTRIHTTTLKVSISPSPEFEKKGLAEFAVNVGTKCGHDCLYCSTGATLRMHKSFQSADENPFGTGYAIVDPERGCALPRRPQTNEEARSGSIMYDR